MTAKPFSFRKKVLNRWIIIRNGTKKLGLFPDFVGASLLGATAKLFTYDDKLNIAVLKKHATVDCYNRQEMDC